MTPNEKASNILVELSHVKTVLGDETIHEDVSFSVEKGEIFAIVGGSGSGKSTLMRAMLSLLIPTAGNIALFGKNISKMSEDEYKAIQKRIGVMFQTGGLFSSMTLLENVAFPLQEFTDLPQKTIESISLLKIQSVGLPLEAASKYPAELSGGMQKRASVARAIAMDPELLFLDEPTAGIDPHGATGLDELILHLKSMLRLTIVIVTHDLNTLWRAATRVAFLGEGKILGIGTMESLSASNHPVIHAYFNDPRARAARNIKTDNADGR